MNQPFRTIEDVPERLRESLESYGVTHKQWSGILIFCCSFPYCLVMSEDPRFMLRHVGEHGMVPEPSKPREAEETIFQGQTLVIPEVSISDEVSTEERK